MHNALNVCNLGSGASVHTVQLYVAVTGIENEHYSVWGVIDIQTAIYN